ncbi:MAG: hypothetical protein R3C44_12865 [Chloroflexota bacterium]
MTGGVDEAEEALIGADGSLNPYADAPSVQVWLRDSVSGETINPLAEGQFSLIDNAPIVQVVSESTDSGVSLQTVAFYDETESAIRWQVAANRQPESRFDELVIAVRPFRVNRTLTDFAIRYCRMTSHTCG